MRSVGVNVRRYSMTNSGDDDRSERFADQEQSLPDPDELVTCRPRLREQQSVSPTGQDRSVALGGGVTSNSQEGSRCLRAAGGVVLIGYRAT